MAPHYIIICSEGRFRVLERFARPGQMTATLREVTARDFMPMGAARGGAVGHNGGLHVGQAGEDLSVSLDDDQRRCADWLADQIEHFLMERPGQAWAFAASQPLHNAVLHRLRPSVRGSLVESVERNLSHLPTSELAMHFRVRA